MKPNPEKQVPLLLLLRWRHVILSVTAAATVIAFIITLPVFMSPIFKAESIIYPPASNSAKIIAEYDLRFGADKETDEHIQILRSSMLRDSIIKHFDLMMHYGIAADEDNRMYKLYKLYDENIIVERTRYNSISVVVFDEDPALAAKICNEVIKTGDQVKSYILKQNLTGAVLGMQQKINASIKELEMLSNEMRAMNNSIKLDYSSLAKQKYAERIRAEIELRNYITTYRNEKNDAVLQILFDYEDRLSKFYLLKDSYEHAIQSLNTKIADAYVITPAQIPDKKYAPKRTLIVLSTAVAAFILCCGIVLMLDQFNQLKSEYKGLSE
jgi:uncharacterized protein involved in exopolysaccharide biosynthesis